jgi:hypothetical protein
LTADLTQSLRNLYKSDIQYQPVFFFTVLIFTHPMVSYPSIFFPRYIHMVTFVLKKMTSESAKALISRTTSSHQAADSAPLHANCQRLHSAQGQICLASLATQRTISGFFGNVNDP